MKKVLIIVFALLLALPAVGFAKAGGEGGIGSLRSGLRPKPPLARRFAHIPPLGASPRPRCAGPAFLRSGGP